MEAIVTVKRMKDRYGCSGPTARKYLRQCVPHTENPLTAPVWAVAEWESGRMVIPPEISRERIVERHNAGRVIVPRKR